MDSWGNVTAVTDPCRHWFSLALLGLVLYILVQQTPSCDATAEFTEMLSLLIFTLMTPADNPGGLTQFGLVPRRYYQVRGIAVVVVVNIHITDSCGQSGWSYPAGIGKAALLRSSRNCCRRCWYLHYWSLWTVRVVLPTLLILVDSSGGLTDITDPCGQFGWSYRHYWSLWTVRVVLPTLLILVDSSGGLTDIIDPCGQFGWSYRHYWSFWTIWWSYPAWDWYSIPVSSSTAEFVKAASVT